MSSVIKGSSPISLVVAIRNGMVDTVSGKVKVGEELMSLTDAISNGVIDVKPSTGVQGQIQGLTLSDCLRKGLVSDSGKIIDRYSGKNLKVSDAIKRGVMNGDRLEIYDATHKQKISLQDALSEGIIDEMNGKFTLGNDKDSPTPPEKFSFYDAHEKKFIYNPMTLKECDDSELISKDNKIQNVITEDVDTLPLLQAIGYGLVDTELKSVKDVKTGQYVTLIEALQNSIILTDGQFRDSSTDELLPLTEAVKRGHLMTVYLKSIFDIEGIKDQEGGDYISFNNAVANKILDLSSGTFLDKTNNEQIDLQEASKRRLVQVQLLEMLRKPIGINGDKKKDMSLIDAVLEGRLDTNSGLPIDKITSKTVPMEKALQSDLITPRGAAVLKSLLNITVTTATVTQTVKRQLSTSSRPDDDGELNGHQTMTTSSGGSHTTNSAAVSFTQSESSHQRIVRGSSVSSLSALSDKSISDTTSLSMANKSGTMISSSTSCISQRKTSNSTSHRQSITASSATISGKTTSKKNSREERTSKSSIGVGSSAVEKEWRNIPIMIDPKFSSDILDPSKVIEIPVRGFTLREVIEKQWFNASEGVLIFPGAENRILFNECIERCYIDYLSATVMSSSGQSVLNLKEALENNVLTKSGSYITSDGKTISLQQAMRTGKLKYFGDVKVSTRQEKSVHTTANKMEGVRKAKLSSERIENIVNLSPSSKSPSSPTPPGWETVQIKVEPADKGFSEIRNDIIQRRSKLSSTKDSVEQSMGNLKNSTKESNKSQTNSKICNEIKRASRSSLTNSIDTRDINVVKGEERDRGGKRVKSPLNDLKKEEIKCISKSDEDSNLDDRKQSKTKKTATNGIKNNISKHSKKPKSSASSTSSSSSTSVSSSEDNDTNSYRSEITIELEKQNVTEHQHMSSSSSITSELKQSTYVSREFRIGFLEAVSKRLIDFSDGTFLNPSTGETTTISEACKNKVLFDDSKKEEIAKPDLESPGLVLSIMDAFKHCYQKETKTFARKPKDTSVTLQQAISDKWINGQDIIIDIPSNSHQTVSQAITSGSLDGITCDYTCIGATERHFFLDAVNEGLLFAVPEKISKQSTESDVTFSLKESIENGVFRQESCLFLEIVSQHQITLTQAIQIGLIDYRSAKVKSTQTESTYNLIEALEANLIDGSTCRVKDTKTNESMSLLMAYEKGLLIDVNIQGSPFDSITLWEAIERDQLDLESGMFISVHEERKSMTLEEAIYRKYISNESAFIKDTLKKRYCTLSEAASKKIVKHGRIMNTMAGKYLTVRESIELGIVVHDVHGITLIEILDFGMYQPHSGKVSIPGMEVLLTISELIERHIVDITKTVVKSRKTSKFITTQEALRVKDIDPLTGMYGSLNLLEARTQGYLITIDAMKAVQEKFRQAGENLEALNDWLNKVEKEIARQEVLSEDVESLKTQISAMKLIKTDVDDHNRPVNNTLDIIAELVETGADVLSSAELNQLQSEGKQLKERYEHVQDISDKLIKRQVSALEEFNKFSSEMALFRTWLEKAYKILEDKERQLANLNKVQAGIEDFKAFVSDVMTHGADLKFLTISGQKFVDLSKEYISFLNEFRVKLRSSQLKQSESKVSAEVTHASQAYHDLLDRVNKLSDRFSRVGNKSKDYNDAVERAKKWLAATEPKVSKFCNEPIGAEPRVVEEQLSRAKALHSDILINGKLIDDAKHAAASLLDALGDQMSPQERRQIEQTPVELQQRYNTILDAMANWCADLEGALAQSRGVEAALNDLAGWLDNVENQLKNLMKPASLVRERLNEQMRLVQVLQADVDSHEGAMQKMNQSAQEFVQSSKNVRESKKIETKVKEVQTKFQTLVKAVNARTVFLNEVSTSLDVFTVNVEAFDEWYIEIIELLESPELLTDETGAKVDDIAKRKDKKRPEFEDMMKNGKNLVGKKDVTDTEPCKDTIKELEEKWRELADILGERQNANRARKQSLNAYEALREQVNNWLLKMERKLEEMDPIALEADLLKRQIDELKPLITEHGGYSKTIEKLYELGMQYDAILTGAGTSPSRRPSVSPRRPSMSPSGMGGIGSRRSSAAISKFGSTPRRESQALQGASMLRESPIQGQLEEVSNRYDMIGIRLGDRNQELTNMSNEIKLQMENLKKIHAFLEKQEKNFPREGVPSDKKDADKQQKLIKGILDQMYENQPILDETKVAIKDILRKNANAPGSEKLDGLLGDAVSRWKDLQDKCKHRLNVLDELKDFNDLHDNLNTWMNSKGRLLNVLGPIASDPRVVENQISQLAVMREELNEKVPTKDQYNGLGESLIELAGGSDRNIEGKLDGTNKKWDELDRALQERENALKDIIGPTRDFMALANKLSDNLTKISDDIDDVSAKKADPSEKLKALEGIAGNLDNQRPLLADVQGLGDHLQEILTDPASKAEVKGKVAQVERQFNNCERKLGLGLAELENAARESKEFGEKCQEIMDMLDQFDKMLSQKLAVSADKDILQQQVQDFEPLYHEIMGQEHEVIMLINRGRDVISRAPKGDQKNLQKNLDTIDKQWQKIKKTAQDRQKRLNTSMEHCKKYVTQQGVFVPWLDKAEQQLERMQPISFVKAELQKQEKELQSFRNDVNRHGSDYDGTHSGGSTFVASCDVDKEIVTEELAILKERWDHLNMAIAERAAAISDVMAKLGMFNDDARDLDNNMSRLEGKLKDLEKKPQDAKTLDAIKGMLDDTKDMDKLFGKLENEGEDLINDADHLGSDASNIKDTLDGLGDRLNGLRGSLEDKADSLKNAGAAMGEFNEFLKELASGIGMLDDELNKMGAIARDLDTLHFQLDEVQGFLSKVSENRKEVSNASKAADDLISKGIAPNAREIKDTISGLSKQLDKLDQRGRGREKDVDGMIVKVAAFNDQYQGVMNEIHGVIEEEKSFGSIGGDIATIKRQQEDFKNFQRKVVEAVGKEVDKTNRSGQGLIQSAASGVNTSILEEDLEKMNELWNTLKQNIADREKRLAQGMLQSGKFQEALNDLLSWFDSMDDMMNNQKPPSSDYKVVKAQVQEQKFVAKLLGDRKSAIDALLKTGAEIAATADPSEKRRIEGEMNNIQTKYSDLNKKCQDRMDLLEDAMQMAKEYQDNLGPLEKWLDLTEKKVKDMEVVPTEEDQIQKRINEHDKLHQEILGKQPSFDDVADIATALMQVVGDEDAQGLADKIEELTNRYGALVNNSDNIHQLLQDCMNGLRALVFAYEDLLTWMEGMDKKLEKYRVLSVFQEKLLEQMEEIHAVTEEVVSKQEKVDEVLHHGSELMKHIASEEALQLKDKLDSLQRKYNDLATKAADLLKNAQDMLPLVQNFHQSHNRLSDWMTGVEGIFQSLDTYTLEEQEMELNRLEQDVLENRTHLESINLTGPQLCQSSPGEGAKTIEDIVTRDNRRFDAICEQIQRRSERIKLSKQRSGEILTDINELLDWFREVENQLREADPPSSEADVIRVQLKEQKALNDDIASQKGRVRDVLATAKKLLRESAETRETEQVKEKMEDLKETMETVIKLSGDRLAILEQALPLSEHFHETHNELNQWLDEIERETMNQLNPGMRPDQIAKQLDLNRSLMQSVQDHKPVIDRLNKTGGALLRLVIEDDAYRVQEIIESDNERYNNLKAALRERMNELEKAMQECSEFTDQLDGMLNSLQDTADQVRNAEPVAAHCEKIKEQMDDNNAIIEDLSRKEEAYKAVKKAASDIVDKAPNKNDPAIKDIKKKLDKLNDLWKEIETGTKNRSKSLEDALALAEKFWDELQNVMSQLKEIQENLNSQEPPAIEPKAIEKQKDDLKNIKKGMDKTKPNVDRCKEAGKKLLNAVGDSEKPELRRHIDDLDNAWGNITGLYAKREKSLIDAMERAMQFHDMLQSILDFLKTSEREFDNFGPIASDIDAVKKQIGQLKDFKDKVDPWMVKVEGLNRRASDLCEYATPQQARAIKEPLSDINRRWEDLNRAISTRQKDLENALLRLGQFQHALNELLAWIESTNKTVNTLKPVYGDPQVIEVELAKLKVMVNDIQAHQSSVDTLNDAGRQIIETEKGSREASQTQNKLNELNTKWNDLLGNAESRQVELEDALKEAQAFAQEIQDMLLWLNDVDAALSSSKPVGGLPETAKDQLDRFMEVFKELEGTGPKVEALLGRGNDYLKKSKDGGANNLQNNLRTLKSRWDNILTRANDKKIKLEIALKEAIEFHDALQAFIEWLTDAEKKLGNLKPVSRVLNNITVQIEEHKEFQNEVSAQRETMLSLDKKGTHLKYFSQKQDVILIKNLLVSVQNRWEKVVSKSAERTRSLDYGFKEAKEFHESWEFLCTWLDEAKGRLDEMGVQSKNDPAKIKREIEKLKDFQKELSSKQPMYDATMKNGKVLTDKAPKPDHPILKEMLTELKNKWMTVCNLSVEKQRKLEEALLLSGQFKDALKALMDWLKKIGAGLDDKSPVHGDLDTVIGLVEKHKNFEEELNSRTEQYESLTKTAEELLESADREDKVKIQSQLTELTTAWENIWTLSQNKTKRLEGALSQAEELHKSVNMLLEWLSDAEMKLRFSGPLPEDEDEVQKQIDDHEKFMAELKEKEIDKDFTLNLAQEILSKCHPDAVNIIKHWITIIQQRWDEISTWALQRLEKLQDHLKQLKDLLALLDELMQWLIGKENILTELEQEPLPDDSEVIKKLIDEHQEFMDNLSSRQPEIDAVCKPMRPKSQAPSSRKTSKIGRPGYIAYGASRDSREQSPDREPSRRTSYAYARESMSPSRDYPKPWLDYLNEEGRISPASRDTPDRRGAPRFPDRKSSRASVAGPKEDGIKNPRAKALWDKWRHVWMMAWERDRRLKEKLGYLHELEKVKNFNWDEWRKRFLKHHNNKKSRVTDLFRKLDEDADGFLSRDDFIEGILKNKFPSSRLEMNAVADKFDHGDGQIDWREFIAALRPDWEDRGPLTDTERIDDEINRQVALCTCRQKFKVFQVGEGKYRFGDSQKLRLVRILRSTVMVRVGGGWMALDEFLVKNDPCRVHLKRPKSKDAHNFKKQLQKDQRCLTPKTPDDHEWWCPYGIQIEIIPLPENGGSRKSSASSRKTSQTKGRTNVELREQFTLASGVSQSMTPFKAKPRERSPSGSISGESQRQSVSGPITKIKEKSERSLPMPRQSMNPEDAASIRKYRDEQMGFTGRRQSGIPGSRGGSRPSSRAGSNLSLNSDDSPRGSNVRRSSSMRGAQGRASLLSQQTPVGFGSSSPRRISTPVTNGAPRSGSNASMDRNPMSGRERSKSYITPRPSKLIKTSSQTNIPVFIGCYSNSNSKKNSLSSASTPVRPDIPEEWDRERKRSMIPRYVGKKKSASTATTPTFTSAIAEECKKISMAYMDQAASKPDPRGDILDLGDEETNALIDKIMQGTEGSGDIIDLDMLLSGAAETQSEPSATPARSRTSSNSSIPIPTNLRTRTPTGGIQRSGSNLAANSRTANSSTTTAYGADGSRVTTTRSSTSYSSNAQNQSAQQATRNW